MTRSHPVVNDCQDRDRTAEEKERYIERLNERKKEREERRTITNQCPTFSSNEQ
jgi:hypothetical protein